MLREENPDWTLKDPQPLINIHPSGHGGAAGSFRKRKDQGADRNNNSRVWWVWPRCWGWKIKSSKIKWNEIRKSCWFSDPEVVRVPSSRCWMRSTLTRAVFALGQAENWLAPPGGLQKLSQSGPIPYDGHQRAIKALNWGYFFFDGVVLKKPNVYELVPPGGKMVYSIKKSDVSVRFKTQLNNAEMSTNSASWWWFRKAELPTSDIRLLPVAA